MLIILEGVDGAGKSTFANALADRIGRRNTDIRHCGPPEGDAFAQYIGELHAYYPRHSEHRIIDRLHLGELIYGPYYRAECKLTDWQVEVIHERLRILGGLIVHMTAPLGTIEERVGVRGDDMVHHNDLKAIHASYINVCAGIEDAPLITVDSSHANALTQVIAFARLLEDHA